MDEQRAYVKGAFLGRGAFKTVFRAINRNKGREVAWNEIKLGGDVDIEKLAQEMEILKLLKGEHFIDFYTCWIDDLTLVFITEIMDSGTLRSFLSDLKRRKDQQKTSKKREESGVSTFAIKDWCTQILQGLVYLHGLNPPIIHRDIKLDNIFFHGSEGQVKIGDLGLATLMQGGRIKTVTGNSKYFGGWFFFSHFGGYGFVGELRE
eukprot:TRINITY_DN13836_c0_g1_i5.p1 TRINITY_DN13836_c0_g1~~TRINITY_DN13836_c0_g1_i5.p1  ORF type:complete len:206 (+),score=36.28 TRINITY_DN13836_c0_g1_i5:1671-2288(+)